MAPGFGTQRNDRKKPEQSCSALSFLSAALRLAAVYVLEHSRPMLDMPPDPIHWPFFSLRPKTAVQGIIWEVLKISELNWDVGRRDQKEGER